MFKTSKETLGFTNKKTRKQTTKTQQSIENTQNNKKHLSSLGPSCFKCKEEGHKNELDPPSSFLLSIRQSNDKKMVWILANPPSLSLSDQ